MGMKPRMHRTLHVGLGSVGLAVDDAALREELAGVCAGDAAALQRMLVYYHAALRGRIERMLPTVLRARIDPEDVLQEAYAAAFRQFHQARFTEPAGFYG